MAIRTDKQTALILAECVEAARWEIKRGFEGENREKWLRMCEELETELREIAYDSRKSMLNQSTLHEIVEGI